ncbi:hypothetical protein OKA04_07625 [Luteolibacter flavescens]|uniref:Protein BatD n=1 Tax=Luteolibacter flavescens TaxID=1859460 RepID=A0ABT3FM05_9BACT|nr:hypothetical protein [Luteolibacter flavescens]MCW1884598.1 hypothetical protein [Luteolibacter flavescens]
MIRRALIALLLAASPLLAETPTQRVGQPLEISDVYIPGGEVKPKPRRDRKPPLMVRVLEVKPAKDGSRYDFEVQGLEAGTYNLAEFLDAPEGTTLPAIPLEITSGLPDGLVHPNKNEAAGLPELGGYRTKMMLFVSLWIAGFVGILMWKKSKPAAADDGANAHASLAERLRPLVGAAAKGELSSDDRAKLERLVIGHWRESRPDIAALAPAEAMVKLRTDADASPLVLALERWLHAPSSHTTTADIEKLLAPYSGSSLAS